MLFILILYEFFTFEGTFRASTYYFKQFHKCHVRISIKHSTTYMINYTNYPPQFQDTFQSTSSASTFDGLSFRSLILVLG